MQKIVLLLRIKTAARAEGGQNVGDFVRSFPNTKCAEYLA